MGHQSKIAELGVLSILNQMKNPLTNIRLCIDMLESEVEDKECTKYREIIKKSAISLEESIRDFCNSFSELNLSIHMQTNQSLFEQNETKK
jgi:nitrogen-specific signal transduction histidine kinase